MVGIVKYFTYARFSDPTQAEGSSEERQLEERARRARASELGAEFVELPYIDRGRSGFYGHHLQGALGRMKDDIASGKIAKGSIIRIESHSRLGQLRPGEAVMEFFGLLKSGIGLDIKGNVRTWSGINGEQGLPILMMDFVDIFVAHQESANKSAFGVKTNKLKRDKVRAGQREGVKIKGRGCFVGERCHAWLEPLPKPIDGYMYRVIPEIREQLRPIMRLSVPMGGPAVAQRANAMGIKPLGKSAGWTGETVRNFTRDRAIIGEYQPAMRANAKDADGIEIWGKRVKVTDGEPIPNYYPPLFPEGDPDHGLFWLVQEASRERNKTGRGRKGKAFSNLVTGIGTCAVCGGKLRLCNTSGKGRRTTKYLRCTNHTNQIVLPPDHPLAGQCCPNGASFRYQRFEELLFWLFEPAMAPMLAQLIPDIAGDDLATRRLADCEAKIAENATAIDRYVGLIAKPGRSDSVIAIYDGEIRKLDAENVRLKRDRDRWELQLAAAGHPTSLVDRVRAAKARLDAADEQSRYEARANLHVQLRDAVACLLLHDGPAISIAMNGSSTMPTLGITFTPEHIIGVSTFSRDGEPARDISADEIEGLIAHLVA